MRTTFKLLLESILVKDYEKASKMFMELGFLLPGADLKIIERMLKEVMSMDLGNIKEMDMFALKKEMNDLVRSLPITSADAFCISGTFFRHHRRPPIQHCTGQGAPRCGQACLHGMAEGKRS